MPPHFLWLWVCQILPGSVDRLIGIFSRGDRVLSLAYNTSTSNPGDTCI